MPEFGERERDLVTINAGRDRKRGRSDSILNGWSPESQGCVFSANPEEPGRTRVTRSFRRSDPP
jgi:hypothetical protein